MSFTNDYWEPAADRDIYLDRLDVRDAAGRVVASRELEEIEPSGDCDGAYDDHFGLYCGGAGSGTSRSDIAATGRYKFEIVAWARHAGEGLPGLSVLVEGRGRLRSRGRCNSKTSSSKLYDEFARSFRSLLTLRT